MEIENLFAKIENFGKVSGIFTYSTIGHLSKSCCTAAKTEVIDFDTTKELICKQHNLQTLKSCDALKFSPKQSAIDFIEMKGFKEFIARRTNPADIKEETEEKLKKFDFETKIRDSITIITNIVAAAKLQLTTIEQKKFHKAKKNYIILSDISIEQHPIHFLAATLDFLGNASSSVEKNITTALKREISNVKLSDFHNIQQPILMSCNSIDNYYNHDNLIS